jgi:hypothetical protein
MNFLLEKQPNGFEGFWKIENKLVWPHLEACSEKIAWLNREKTAQLCRENDEIIAKYMAFKGIDFFAALNSLEKRI